MSEKMFDENGKLQINTLEENMEFYEDKYSTKFGLVDISPASVIGEDVAISAEVKKNADEGTQYAFMQNSPYEAIDEGLENLCLLRGITKKKDEHSLALVIFAGTDGTVIEAGTLIEEETTKEIYETLEKGTISNGTFSTFAKAQKSGRIPCKKTKINKLVETIEGVTVSNPNDGIIGFDVESNSDLRKRLLKFDNALNINEKLEQDLLNLPNVKLVNIVSNKTNETDANGIDARSTSIVVLGGNDKEIAKTIFTSPADYTTIGTSEIIVASSVNSKSYPVYFSRPDVLFPTVQVSLTTDSSFDVDDLGVIKESILSFFKTEFALSDDVMIDKLYIPAQQDVNNQNLFFKGITRVSITLNGGTSNQAIAYNEYADLLDNNLSVQVV